MPAPSDGVPCGPQESQVVDGALLEDIAISNITMRDIQSAPVFMRLGARMRGPEGVPIGHLRRVNVNNLVVSSASAKYSCILSGIPGHEIEDVKFSNIFMQFQGGGTREDATLVLAEKENNYPEPTMFGTTPAYGFFIRHVKGLEMNHVELRCLAEDFRPSFVLDDVRDADFMRIKAQQAAGVPIFGLKNVEDFHLYLSRPLADTHLERVEDKKL